MNMHGEALKRPAQDFVIEATSHCRTGKAPRWSFLIQGVDGNDRHAMVGTDERGCGLYLFASPLGAPASSKQLVAPQELSLSDSLSRQQANQIVAALLHELDWSQPPRVVRPGSSRPDLHLVT